VCRPQKTRGCAKTSRSFMSVLCLAAAFDWIKT
jgi:hypothetical protein